MQTYELTLKSPVSKSFRCKKAADSLDIDSEKKSVHHFKVDADIESDYNVGLIVGASGSGKTTFANDLWGVDKFPDLLVPDKPVIEQFPKAFKYDECVKHLSGVGLTSVPCWIRPAYTLSNGQKARAEIALRMAADVDFTVVDEWTSVVDRTVAKVMSHSVQKHVRRTEKRIVLLSCHYDVIDWLNPDWVIDCNDQTYTDRRLLRQSYKRKEKLKFEIREVERSTWKSFSKYHYLSDRLPGGIIRTFGMFHNGRQIGFECFANYTPHRRGDKRPMKMHSNRCVIHPDFVGLGLGIKLVDVCSGMMVDEGYDVWAKLSAAPMVRHRMNEPDKWELMNVSRTLKVVIGGNMIRDTGFRSKVKTYSFRWIGGALNG